MKMLVSHLLIPVLVGAVTFTPDPEVISQRSSVDARSPDVRSVMRRESTSRADAAIAEDPLLEDSPIMALKTGSGDATAEKSESSVHLLSDGALKAAVLAAEARTDLRPRSADQKLKAAAVEELAEHVPANQVYYMDADSGAMSFLGEREHHDFDDETGGNNWSTSARTIWTMRGPKGHTGNRGPPGLQGLQGQKGPTGWDFHGDIDLTNSRGPPGSQGPSGAPGDHGPHGDRGPPGPQGTKGTRGNFTPMQEKEFASLTRQMHTALKRADAMDEMEHLVLSTRLNRLKSHFAYLEKNLTAEEIKAKEEKEEAKRRMKQADAINEVTKNASAAVAEAQAAEKDLIKREAKLKDQILTITQEEQNVLNAPLPPGMRPPATTPCPKTAAAYGAPVRQRRHYR